MRERGTYRKGSQSTDKRPKKLAAMMEKTASQTPHIGALFQRQVEMTSQPVHSVTSVSFLSQLLWASSPLSL